MICHRKKSLSHQRRTIKVSWKPGTIFSVSVCNLYHEDVFLLLYASYHCYPACFPETENSGLMKFWKRTSTCVSQSNQQLHKDYHMIILINNPDCLNIFVIVVEWFTLPVLSGNLVITWYNWFKPLALLWSLWLRSQHWKERVKCIQLQNDELKH